MARYINLFTDFKIIDRKDLDVLSKDERKAYEMSLKHMRDYNNTVNFAREEGHEEGLAEGIEKGREEGLAEGMEKGFEQGVLQMASKMKANGISIDAISQMTGLSKDLIDSI